MKPQKYKYGFEILRSEKIDSISSVVTRFRHTKTGAEVLHIRNKDPENFYSIGFKTPPTDNTGLPHIFEHVTMMGSKKYPVRDAFIGLLRKAHTSFLNAMTYPDKTVYPVASTSKEEFKKLFRIYTDLAFNPTVYDNPEVFLQEGVRFDVDEEDNVSLNGVVLNEMKGRLAPAESQLYGYGTSALFPDTQYQYNSGGDPDAIPALQYEDLLEFHQKHYHPSHAHVVLYGDFSADSYLRYLDKEYFSKYEPVKPIRIGIQKRKKLKNVKRSFTSDGKKEYASYSFLLEKNTNVDHQYEWSILSEILMGDDNAPLRRALLDSKLAQDYAIHVEDEMAQLFMMITAKDLKPQSSQQFKKVVDKTLRKLVTHGIDPVLVERAVSQHALHLKAISGKTTMGLRLMDLAESGWLYGADPIESLMIAEKFEERKHKLTATFFEKKIQKFLQDNDHKHIFNLVPTKKDIQTEALEKIIAKKKKSLGATGLQDLKRQQEDFKKWQKTDVVNFDDVYETLSLDTISDTPVYGFEWRSHKKAGIRYHRSPQKSELDEIAVSFDISHLDVRHLPALTLFTETFLDVDNAMYTKEESKYILDTKTLGIHSEVLDVKKGKSGMCSRLWVLHLSVLPGFVNEVLSVVKAGLYGAQIQKKKINELISTEKAALESHVAYFRSAIPLVAKRLVAKLDSSRVSIEYASGISYLQTLRDVSQKELYERVLDTQELIKEAAVTDCFLLSGQDLDLGSYFVSGKAKKTYRPKLLKSDNEAFFINSSSHMNGLAMGIKDADSPRGKAAHMLLGSFVNPTYLWRAIRDDGGAYGGRITRADGKNLVYQSWSDPRVADTFKDFAGTTKYVENTSITHDDLDTSKVTSFAKLDAPQSTTELFVTEMKRTLRGIKRSEVVAMRKQLRSMKPGAFKKSALSILSSKRRKNFLSIGGEKSLKSSGMKYQNHIDLR